MGQGSNERHMRKFIVLVVAALIAMSAIFLTGCNKQILDFNNKYTHAYIKLNEEWMDVEITAWNDYEGDQLQIILKDGTVIVIHSLNCILYNGTLPTTKDN